MGLRTRILALERKVGDSLREKTMVLLVPSFQPGPDADPSLPGRIVVRDRSGNQRIVSGLREFYSITVIDPREITDGIQDPPDRVGA